MKIMPIINNINTYKNNNIDFKSKQQYDDYDEDNCFFELNNHPEIKSNLMLTVGTILGTMLGILADKSVDNYKNSDFSEKVINVCKTNKIKQDTFTVEDINFDGSPELIVYKKDGAPIAIDWKNKEIIE